MITEFTLRNYRGFSDFSLSGCSQVNLFVGKNNAGKSSLLEALYLFFCKMDLEVLQSIAIRRGEMIMDPRGRDAYTVDMSHFFNGHRIKSAKSPIVASKDISYSIKVASSDHFEPQMGLLPFENASEMRQPLHSLKIIENRNGAEKSLQEAVVFEQGAVSLVRRNSMYGVAVRRRNHFIAPDSLDYQTLASLWNNILVSNDELSIVNALKLLDGRVASVAFLPGEQYPGRFSARAMSGVVVGLDDTSKRVPLGSLGDGMKRLMSIAAALSCAKNGALFIDEIDAGFHYSVMKDLWRLVVRTAIANNVQVFASTHSLDCIRGLSVLSEKSLHSEKGVFSLYSIASTDRYAVHYSADEIPGIIRNEIEVRQ